MRLLLRALLIAPFVFSLALAADRWSEKPSLGHDDYDSWSSLTGQAISLDGRVVAWSEKPQRGDSELVVRDTESGAEHRYPRGESPRISSDGAFVVFRIAPSRDQVRAFEYQKLEDAKAKKSGNKSGAKPAKRGGKKRAKGKGKGKGASASDGDEEEADEKPLPALGVLDLSTGSVRVVERLKSFRVPAEGPAYAIYELEPEKKKGKKDKKTEEEEEPAEKKAAEEEGAAAKGEGPSEGKESESDTKDRPYRKDGALLILEELASGDTTRIEGVNTWGIGDKSGWIWFACSSKKDDPNIERGLFAHDLASGQRVRLVEGAATYRSFTTDREEERLAFLSTRRDRDAEKPTSDLMIYRFGDAEVRTVVSHTDTEGFAPGTCVSEHRAPSFCRDGSALLFGVGELPEEDLPPVLSEDKVTLDLWHYGDGSLQPMQKLRASRDRNASLSAVWHIGDRRMVTVSESPQESVRFVVDDGSKALVSDDAPYRKYVSWDQSYRDVYLVNTVDGSRTQILGETAARPQTSPDGRYLLYEEDGDWQSIDLLKMSHANLTQSLDASFVREDWDTPNDPRSYGSGGFVEGGTEVLLYDRFDIWRAALDGSSITCVTDGYGRAERLRFRVVTLDSEQRYVPLGEDLLLSAFSEETMASGYYSDRIDKVARPREIVMLDQSFGRLQKAKNSDRLFFTLQSFGNCGDLWTATPGFGDRSRLSELNPQQDDYRWGTAELVHWRSQDGAPLDGILIKPEGFDPDHKYPMLVYFYEKMSQQLHRYRAPSPGTSPSPTYYASNGYLVFIPDIIYREGYPGESCVKCVVPGVQSVVAKGFVDEAAIGAAGHSWGGYQTAYLIAHTNIFAAVESGAPVSNMTSAYGGIRWGSGMSRAFQYEKTQSRIGGTLWEYPMRYLENSPLFAADKIETPVLILHNDEDGAVPWYQGIEFFCALRRLGKEAYLFNYNGQAHGLRRRADQVDWTIRMKQYFDHHLLGEPMPEWMANGVPFVDREKEKHAFNPPWRPAPSDG